ncbi:pyruvate dehydrogenase E1 alpha, partial [Striga asiatica]
MDYINTSHPNFIGDSKAVDMTLQMEIGDSEKADRNLKSPSIIGRQVNGVVSEQVVRPAADTGGSSWGMSSIFGGHDNHSSAKDKSTSKPSHEPLHIMEQTFSMIHLREAHYTTRYLIIALKKYLTENKLESEADLKATENKIEDIVGDFVEFADKSPGLERRGRGFGIEPDGKYIYEDPKFTEGTAH